jgi:hypothetical protein
MIINAFKAGQLGNRLFHVSQLIVLAKETNSILVDYSFDDYKENFEHLKNEDYLLYPPGKRNFFLNRGLSMLKGRVANLRDFILHRKLSGKLVAYINQNGLKMEDYQTFLNERKKNRHYIIEGWINRDLTPLHLHRKLLADFFEPAKQHSQNVTQLITRAFNGVDLLIGIHIRRGDYKEYKQGLYYFDDTVYAGIMAKIQQTFAGKKLRFLICSNEEIEWNNYAAFDTIRANGHIIEDMYSLSYCDYIAGPISTYSMWASFIGEKPLFQILDKNAEFNLDRFKIVKDRAE